MEHFSDNLLNEGIVARDSSMVKLYSDALSIAPTDANILITGASGTGKDCLAKFIHRHSPRAGAPFIHINCSAIPSELFESEFFGYESGAFTGKQRVPAARGWLPRQQEEPCSWMKSASWTWIYRQNFFRWSRSIA